MVFSSKILISWLNKVKLCRFNVICVFLICALCVVSSVNFGLAAEYQGFSSKSYVYDNEIIDGSEYSEPFVFMPDMSTLSENDGLISPLFENRGVDSDTLFYSDVCSDFISGATEFNSIVNGCFRKSRGARLMEWYSWRDCICLDAFDVDDDGVMDLIVGILNSIFVGQYSHVSGVYHPNNVYTLPNVDEYYDDISYGGFAVGDFNGDGKDDFVSGGYFGLLRLHLNNFSETHTIDFEVSDIGDVGLFAFGLTSGDFNNDGLDDFAVASSSDFLTYSKISIFFNQNNNSFFCEDIFEMPFEYIHDLDAGDFDNDGDVDLMFSKSEEELHRGRYFLMNGSVLLLENSGGNVFLEPREIVKHSAHYPFFTELWFYFWYSTVLGQGRIRTCPYMTVADYDADCDLDMLVGDSSGKVELFVNDGVGGFSSEGCISDYNENSYGLASADFEGDGDIDVMIAAFETIDLYLQGYFYLKPNVMNQKLWFEKPVDNYIYIGNVGLTSSLVHPVVLGRLMIKMGASTEFERVDLVRALRNDTELIKTFYEPSYEFMWIERNIGLCQLFCFGFDDQYGVRLVDEILVIKII